MERNTEGKNMLHVKYQNVFITCTKLFLILSRVPDEEECYCDTLRNLINALTEVNGSIEEWVLF